MYINNVFIVRFVTEYMFLPLPGHLHVALCIMTDNKTLFTYKINTQQVHNNINIRYIDLIHVTRNTIKGHKRSTRQSTSIGHIQRQMKVEQAQRSGKYRHYRTDKVKTVASISIGRNLVRILSRLLSTPRFFLVFLRNYREVPSKSLIHKS
jgi:hypothetical protein